MKITFAILLVAFMQVSAASFGQKITLSEKDAPFEKILTELRQQSGYNFLYNTPMLDEAKPVTINVVNTPVEDVLKMAFAGQPLDYTVKNKTIVIKRKAPVAVNAPKQQAITVTGTVVDEKGVALPGVSVLIKGTQTGIVTDINGKYTINVPTGNETLVFTFIGYVSQEVAVNNRTSINIQLAVENQSLSEVVVVGYGTQKKVTLTGAVSSIKSDEITTTKNENIQNALTGKIAGVRVVQNTAEPGTFTNTFDIRGLGTPLIVIDGVPRDNVTRLDMNDVESISVLKDASAAVYGVRAANGVVLVTTKKGKKGTEFNYTGTFTVQKPSGLPRSQDAIGYMTLRNEAAKHNVNGGTVAFSDADFAPYLSGAKTSTDWYTPVIKGSVPQSQHNLSASGGNETTKFFASLGYTAQDGFLRSGDLNYRRYNVRSNLSSQLTKRLSLDLNISGILDQKHQPYNDAWWIIRSFWRQNPLDNIYANNNGDYLFNPSVDGTNPIALSNESISGYKNYINRWFQSSINLTYDVPGITGLKAKGLFSYDYNTAEGKAYQKEYTQYTYDASANVYNPVMQASPSSVYRDYFTRPTILTQMSLNYDRVIGNDHSISGLVLLENVNRKSDNFNAQRNVSLPIDNIFAGDADGQIANMSVDQLYNYSTVGFVGKFNYAYKGKYLAEFSFRRDGSSKNSPLSRYGFFPGGSVGWRVSEEGFIKNNKSLSFIDNLKVRASYGLLGDDANLAYQYVTGYTYPASGEYNKRPGGYVFDGKYINALESRGIPNPYFTWMKSKTFDAGIDFEGWRGLLGFTFDYFRRERTGMPSTRVLSLPDVIGVNLPQENLNSDLARGFDLEINHRNKIGNFNYFVKAILSYTRIKNLYVERAQEGNSYANWRNNSNNRYNNTYWGYTGNGQFQNYDAIVNSPVYVDRGTIVGDYAYEDWNGDGVIDDNDIHPIGYTGAPLMNFGLTLGGSYKGFDVNLLFQGSSMANVSYIEQLREAQFGGGSGLAQFLDRWHPVDPSADIYSPNTVWVPGHFAYTGTTPYENSTFNLQNSKYLRLKSAEFGYTFPTGWMSKLGIKGARIYVNGYNLWTLSDIKYVDPEHPSDTYGYLYPLNKTYSVGLNVKF
ncbi:TonB-dependent receptor [Mucilaginibacter gynuensis]|uniref:TonB-dependent receptor n=1 Tax=Mucilaginibacter gynuensis TaxID=1302236 RepID=A0ABP8FU78_9SPHI